MSSNSIPSRRMLLSIVTGTIFLSTELFAQSAPVPSGDSAPSSDSAPSADPIPKGYDESFQTGDLPKPNTPEMDPDVSNENEVTPDTAPDANPENDPTLDKVPDRFLIGGTAAITFPHLLNFGVETLFHHRFGISLDYGSVTKSINNIDVAMQHQDVRFRWFPWAGSFFVGLGFGQHQLTGELNRDVQDPVSKQTISTRGKLAAKANYILPHVGFFSIWDSGFTLGCDIGYLAPSKATSSFSSTFSSATKSTEEVMKNTTEYKKMKSDLEDSAESYASKPLPYVTFMRIGWMF